MKTVKISHSIALSSCLVLGAQVYSGTAQASGYTPGGLPLSE